MNAGDCSSQQTKFSEFNCYIRVGDTAAPEGIALKNTCK